MKKQVQKGFTLIELMIVVAIIGILASIALPAYSDYTTRAKVSEGIIAGSAAKASVSEYYITQEAMPTTASDAGISTAAIGNIAGISYTAAGTKGTIKIKMDGNKITSLGTSDTFQLVGSGTTGGVTWVCKTDTMLKKYLPASCRN